MENFFIQLVLILITARLLGEVAAHFKVPAVIGELLAGILLGPSLLQWIEPTPVITVLAEIGIVLLLFEIGLETDISRLAKNGLSASMCAFAGVVAPFLLGYVLSRYLFALDLLPSLFIASTLTATSIGITMRVLADLKRQTSHESQIVLGAAILDDVIGIVLLSILYEFSTSGQIDLINIGKVLGFITLFLLLAPVAVKLISTILKRYEEVSEIPGLLPSTIVSLILLFAWLAHACGAPELLGGFAAGLALSHHFVLPLPRVLRTGERFSHRIEEQMRPIIHLFTPIFFVYIGLSLNLREIAWESSFVWVASGVFLVAAMIGKLCSGWILLKETAFTQWAVGLAMIPRGEVGLIFAQIGKNSGVFNQDLYAAMIMVIAFTTIFSPIFLRLFYKRYPQLEG